MDVVTLLIYGTPIAILAVVGVANMTPGRGPRPATIRGFLIAPLAASLALLAAEYVRQPPSQLHFLEFMGVLGILYFYAAVATIWFGLPSFIVLHRLKAVRWWSAALVGFGVAGTVLGLVATFIDERGWRAIAGDVQTSLFWCCTGAFGGIVFWLFWNSGVVGERGNAA